MAGITLKHPVHHCIVKWIYNYSYPPSNVSAHSETEPLIAFTYELRAQCVIPLIERTLCTVRTRAGA
jgi:hypothetical protein